ncbi:MAG TPA: HEAT repeat domain-containing protein [Coleofasciculaceae cyanobacterium]
MTSSAQQLIRAVEVADSAISLAQATQVLAQARLPEGIPTLIAVLSYNNPGAAVAAVDGLIQLGEPAVQPLIELLDGYNYSGRAWGIRALAGLEDPRALNLLLDAARHDFALSVRRAAARGLGSLRWQQLPAEQMRSAHAQTLETLLVVAVEDVEWVVRYAAIVGLQRLAQTVEDHGLMLPILHQFAQSQEQDPEIAVRCRARLAQQQVQTQQPQLATV